jgi:hypothetical protein
MKKNKIAIVLVFFLGTAAVWFVINNGASTINYALKDFAVSDTASINKISLTDKSGTIVLERQTEGAWKLNVKHYADNFAIKKLLYTINKVDVKTIIGKNNEDAVVQKLVESAVKCDIYENGKLSKSYYVGGATPDNMGTYMVLIDEKTQAPKGSPFITYVPGYNSSITAHYSTDIRHWRDKTVFSYNESDIQSIKVETPHTPENSYELTVGGKSCQLKNLATKSLVKNIDTVIVKQYLTYFFNLNFDSIDTTQYVSTEVPFSIVTVTDVKGVANKVIFYSFKSDKTSSDKDIFNSDDIHLSALLDNGDLVNVKLYLFGKIMPEINYFFKK